jgi:hypothetical protein
MDATPSELFDLWGRFPGLALVANPARMPVRLAPRNPELKGGLELFGKRRKEFAGGKGPQGRASGRERVHPVGTLQRAMGSARAPACIGQRPADRIRHRVEMVSTRASKPTREARVLPSPCTCGQWPRLRRRFSSVAASRQSAANWTENFRWRLSAESRHAGLREFLEDKARNLGDDVINARLEACGRVMECASRAGAATALSGGRG